MLAAALEHLGQPVPSAGGDAHGGSLGRQGLRQSGADPRGPTGDQDPGSIECTAHDTLPFAGVGGPPCLDAAPTLSRLARGRQPR